jgi:hypothetical protein
MIKRTIGIGTILFLILLFVIGVGIGVARGNTRATRLTGNDAREARLYRADRVVNVDRGARVYSGERVGNAYQHTRSYLDAHLNRPNLVGAELRPASLRLENPRLWNLRSHSLRVNGSDLRPVLGVENQQRLLNADVSLVRRDGAHDEALSRDQAVRGEFRHLDLLDLQALSVRAWGLGNKSHVRGV